MEAVLHNIKILLPFTLISWFLTLFFTVRKPHRFMNSWLLFISLCMTSVFLTGLLGKDMSSGIIAGFIITMIILFLVPLFLVINGIDVIRKEGFSVAHILSLAMGLFIGYGEFSFVGGVFLNRFSFNTENFSKFNLCVGYSILYFCMIVLCFVLYNIFLQLIPHRNNYEYVIIHGCGLKNGEKVTKLLAGRCDKAVEIYRKAKVKPILIPSGGQGSDELISEAQAMKNYLLEKGIDEDHMILEDQSKTTMENLINSKKLIEERGGAKRIALISSNYHVFRCLNYAHSIKMKCTGLGGKTAFYYWPCAIIREFVAIFSKKKYMICTVIGYIIVVGPLIALILR